MSVLDLENLGSGLMPGKLNVVIGVPSRYPSSLYAYEFYKRAYARNFDVLFMTKEIPEDEIKRTFARLFESLNKHTHPVLTEPVAVCRCEIRKLTWEGHDDGCPEKTC